MPWCFLLECDPAVCQNRKKTEKSKSQFNSATSFQLMTMKIKQHRQRLLASNCNLVNLLLFVFLGLPALYDSPMIYRNHSRLSDARHLLDACLCPTTSRPISTRWPPTIRSTRISPPSPFNDSSHPPLTSK